MQWFWRNFHWSTRTLLPLTTKFENELENRREAFNRGRRRVRVWKYSIYYTRGMKPVFNRFETFIQSLIPYGSKFRWIFSSTGCNTDVFIHSSFLISQRVSNADIGFIAFFSRICIMIVEMRGRWGSYAIKVAAFVALFRARRDGNRFRICNANVCLASTKVINWFRIKKKKLQSRRCT